MSADSMCLVVGPAPLALQLRRGSKLAPLL
jgi:hypothetical protein